MEHSSASTSHCPVAKKARREMLRLIKTRAVGVPYWVVSYKDYGSFQCYVYELYVPRYGRINTVLDDRVLGRPRDRLHPRDDTSPELSFSISSRRLPSQLRRQIMIEAGQWVWQRRLYGLPHVSKLQVSSAGLNNIDVLWILLSIIGTDPSRVREHLCRLWVDIFDPGLHNPAFPARVTWAVMDAVTPL